MTLNKTTILSGTTAALMLALTGCGEQNPAMYENEAPPEFHYEAPAESDAGQNTGEDEGEPIAPSPEGY